MLIPILTVTFVALHEIISNPDSALTDLAMIMPALNGIFNFVVFIINPALDNTWCAIFRPQWAHKVKQRLSSISSSSPSQDVYESHPSIQNLKNHVEFVDVYPSISDTTTPATTRDLNIV